ncbi:short chain dehydrogenase/ reductase-like protein [Hyaloraphidium curvatum]|nr:short chain dehydrogenase/ reductase-like protein [Hyaloraphidium curvatum]KAI9021354.1 short chain dehydrogenase/ reductase-like protein [Hyaloraphidium curvatum]
MASGNAGGDPASAGTRKAAHHYERYPLGKPFKFNTVLVHGATSGLGYALAEAFLVAPTTKVIVTGRRQERLDEMTSKYGDRVRAYPLDGSRLAELGPWCKKVVEENPDLNAVILNAGLQRQTNFLDPSSISLDELDAEVDTNYTSFLHMIVHFLPHLQGLAKAGTDSYLAVVTSGLALVPLPACANYCATKAALHHLILAIREQLSDPFPNLHVIEILPPLVASELHDHKHQPTLAFDKMSAEDRGKLAEMPVDEFVASVFAGFAKGERDIAVGNTAASFEKLEVGTRFKVRRD